MSENNRPLGLDLEASPAKSLFLGNIIESNIFPFPTTDSGQVEMLKMVIDSIDRFMGDRDEDFREFDQKGDLSPEFLKELKQMGLFGLIIPEEYGGIGLSNSSYSRVVQQSSYYDIATSITLGAHSSIGMKGLLLYGSEEQKKRYLPDLASGAKIAAFCLTEPGSGSDAGSIKTTAKKNADGSWTLNGSKIWITNGGIADFFTVFARTDSEQGKISAFIVEKNWTGVSHGPKEDKMGIRSSNTTSVDFSDVTVPADALLGEEGKGFRIAMSILNSGRTGLGGGCVGAMKRCLKLAIAHSKERKQFGSHIHEFRLIKSKIAQMTVNCFAAESVVPMVAHYIDAGVKDFSVEAAISKVFATEALWEVAYEAMQIAAGSGFMKEYPYERIMRDARINTIFEGTNEILRLYIGLSGMKDAGEYLQELGKSVGSIFNDPIKGFGVLTGYAAKKVSHLTPFGRDKLSAVAPALQDEAKVYEEYTIGLARQTESSLRKHGKNIIGNQLDTKRVAETARDLFVGLCVLSRVTSLIEQSSEADCQREITIARLFTHQAKKRMERSLSGLDKNKDELVVSLADALVEEEEYRWDVI